MNNVYTGLTVFTVLLLTVSMIMLIIIALALREIAWATRQFFNLEKMADLAKHASVMAEHVRRREGFVNNEDAWEGPDYDERWFAAMHTPTS